MAGVGVKIKIVKFYRTQKLGNFAWKIFFRVGDERWKATIVKRSSIAVTKPYTGVRVTIQPMKNNRSKFVKNWGRVKFPEDRDEARLLVALTANEAEII